MLMMLNRAEEALEVLQAAQDKLDGDADLALRLETAILGVARTDLRTRPIVRERLHRIPTPPESGGFGARAVFANLAAEGAMAGRPATEVADRARRALQDGRLLREGPPGLEPFFSAVRALMLAEEFESAGNYLDDALAEARRRGLIQLATTTGTFRAELGAGSVLARGTASEAPGARGGGSREGTESSR